MPIHFPTSRTIRTRAKRIFRPRTKLGKSTLWLGVLCLLFWTADALGSKVRLWAILLTLLFAGVGFAAICRWGYRPLLWRLRNRLIVTYLFIGVMPVLLLLLMGALAAFLFTGQFATYVVITDMHSELQHLEAANNALAAQLFPLEAANKLDERIAGEFTKASDERFPGRTVTILRGAKSFVLSTEGKTLAARPDPIPAFVPGDFTDFIVDKNVLRLHTVRVDSKDPAIAISSDIPITTNLLIETAGRLGSVSLLPLPPDQEGAIGFTPINAGEVHPRSHWFDFSWHFGTLFDVVDWRTGGKPKTGFIYVATRPSVLYATLFATLGDKALFARNSLLSVALFFGLIELAALYIGVRLSRTMTGAVADLYHATEFVNTGDLSHRIQLRGHDQMAALGASFNSMTHSLARLINEQKEKQRLENELSIAYEVQELLFPQKATPLPGLDVHGLCVPARTVSGDYYDFIPLGTDRMVLAVGDISGKGISAALLMATVHAYVRAYSLEPEAVMAPAMLEYQSQSQGDGRMYYRGDDGSDAQQLAPAMLMTTLNYQLYRSTPPAKYATMFLGCYDPRSRTLKYCNAGHLPPILLRATGEVLTLDINGTVVGLFDGVTYEESAVVLNPGDIFVAYSDGVTEPENEFGEFGEDRLVTLIREHRHKPLKRITEIVTSAVADWIGAAEQPDDITIVLARASRT